MRILKKYIFIGFLGIAVGAAGYANLSNRNSTHNLTAINDPGTSLGKDSEPTDQSVVANVATLNSIEPNSDHNDSGYPEYFPDIDKSIANTALDSNTSNSPPESLLFALDGIKIEMLNGLNAEQSVIDQAIDQVAKWLEQSSNPAIDIFNLLTSDASEDIKLSLIHLIASGEYDGLTENILNEMSVADEAAHGEWVNIVSTTSIDSPSERETMLNVLPFLANDSLVIATLGAVRPQLLSTEERSQFLSAISGYASSENEGVQSAAIIALAGFPGNEYSHMIENALSSDTEILKSSAIYAADINGMRSDTIRNQMSGILHDENESISLRAEAFDALRSFDLDEYEYNMYYEFYQENILPLRAGG